MDNMIFDQIIKAIDALSIAFSVFAMGVYSASPAHEENYIRNPKVTQNKYNRIKDLACNHRKKKVRKKNLNRLRKSQIYTGWDLSNV